MMKSPQSSAPIQLTVEVGGVTAEEISCDLLVVACEPRNLENVCDFEKNEKEVFNSPSLVNFTFHTTVVKVQMPTGSSPKPKYGVALSTKAIQDMWQHLTLKHARITKENAKEEARAKVRDNQATSRLTAKQILEEQQQDDKQSNQIEDHTRLIAPDSQYLLAEVFISMKSEPVKPLACDSCG